MKVKGIILWISLFFVAFFSGCSGDDEVRKPDDILGVWSPSENVYLEFSTDNIIHHLDIEMQDGETIGLWTEEVYYYEPGYNLVIYLTSGHEAVVYEIVTMNSSKLVWCPVDEIEATSADEVGQIIGDIIKKAQEGYNLDPELFQSFNRVSEDKFYAIIESLDITYPW